MVMDKRENASAVSSDEGPGIPRHSSTASHAVVWMVLKNFCVIRGGTGERHVEQCGVFTYKGVKTQNLRCGAFMDFAREVECVKDYSHVHSLLFQALRRAGGPSMALKDSSNMVKGRKPPDGLSR